MINVLEVSPEVRSQPLGQKRKRGRPKKLPHCLTRDSPVKLSPNPVPEPLVLTEVPGNPSLSQIQDIPIILATESNGLSPLDSLGPKTKKKRKILDVPIVVRKSRRLENKIK